LVRMEGTDAVALATVIPEAEVIENGGEEPSA
jgi:hypothetical protein